MWYYLMFLMTFLADLPCRRIAWFSVNFLADIRCSSCTLNNEKHLGINHSQNIQHLHLPCRSDLPIGIEQIKICHFQEAGRHLKSLSLHSQFPKTSNEDPVPQALSHWVSSTGRCPILAYITNENSSHLPSFQWKLSFPTLYFNFFALFRRHGAVCWRVIILSGFKWRKLNTYWNLLKVVHEA